MKRYFFILGSHPEIAYAELRAVLFNETLIKKGNVVFFDTEKEIAAPALMEQLGGTIKIGEYVGEYTKDHFATWLFDHIDTTTKFHFGFSQYALDTTISVKKAHAEIQRMGISLKQAMKKNGISARYVQSKDPVLSSVIVHKERLLKNGVEIVLFKEKNSTSFGRTLAVQPFAAFAKRDFGRPGHDARSGMLPPKLARMMINIARPKASSTILDPFCGSGTILQEAWVLGHRNLIGSDKSDAAIATTQKNMRWLKARNIPLHVADAQRLLTEKIVAPQSIDRIIFEGYLGPPTPAAQQIKQIQSELQTLYQNVFPVLTTTLSSDGVIVAALPFWHREDTQWHLAINALTEKSGLVLDAKPLLYRRPQSIVGREIIQLKKSQE